MESTYNPCRKPGLPAELWIQGVMQEGEAQRIVANLASLGQLSGGSDYFVIVFNLLSHCFGSRLADQHS
jgi:hypothetical protein